MLSLDAEPFEKQGITTIEQLESRTRACFLIELAQGFGARLTSETSGLIAGYRLEVNQFRHDLFLFKDWYTFNKFDHIICYVYRDDGVKDYYPDGYTCLFEGRAMWMTCAFTAKDIARTVEFDPVKTLVLFHHLDGRHPYAVYRDTVKPMFESHPSLYNQAIDLLTGHWLGSMPEWLEKYSERQRPYQDPFYSMVF